ncbi:G-protein alpha subunit [Russula aff. rugulosa BPL654]|nr:G-protein alpha subunit [Russula aff. rugulosa BPL654]
MHLSTSWKRRKAEKRAKAWSDEIDLRLMEDAKSFRRLCNVLLMSIPESEAAAFALVKRMKFAHDIHTHRELIEFRPVIWKLLLKNSRSIVMTIQSRNLGPIRPSNKAHCEYIMSHRIDTDSPEFSFQPKFSQAVQDLWAEQVIPVLEEDPSRLSVDDNAAYFFSEVQRIVAENYVPSSEDVLHTAERGILETYFKMGQLSIRVVQVYGQEFGRKKWINRFERVTSIIFCASLCDYDVRRVAAEGERTRLEESLVLFESASAQYFPEYSGGTDVNKGAKYILWRFMQVNRARLNVYPHITQMSDESNLRLIFVTIKEVILQDALRDSDIL